MRGRREDRATWDDEAGELLTRFIEGRARRERVRKGEVPRDLEWDRQPDGEWVLPVREGHVIVLPCDASEGVWDLYMRWLADYGHAFLARGSRGEVELVARRLQRSGPSCGPEFESSSAGAWYRFSDGTERTVIEEGELRLMQPATVDDAVLILAQSGEPDSVAVLGVSDVEALREHADELGERGGESLYLSIGGRPRHLQAHGADGIVGYLELGDDLFVLGHLGDGVFGLAWQSDDVQRGLGRYTLRQVMRGDLGPVLDWSHAVNSPSASPRSRAASSPTRQAAVRRRTRIPESPLARPWRPRLAGAELSAAREHLTPSKDWIGVASTVIPRILAAICGLVDLDLDNETLWAENFLPFLASHTGRRIYCCRKILNTALHIIASRTKLLVRRGRRWTLRFGDLRARGSRLLRWMIQRGALDSDRTPPSRVKDGGRADAGQSTAVPDPKSAADTSTSAADSPPADDATPAALRHEPTTTTSPATVEEAEPMPAPDGPPPAGRPSTSPGSSESTPHAAAASGQPAPSAGGQASGSSWKRLLAAMSLLGDPGTLPPGLPAWMNSFEAFQALLMKTMRVGARRSGRGPGVTVRGWPSWTDEEDLDHSGPRVSRGPPGKRRPRPP